MKKNKSKLQKVSLGFAIASIILAVACVVYLYFNVEIIGWESPVSASFLASVFFFLFVSLVLFVIGTANIPSFKVTTKE